MQTINYSDWRHDSSNTNKLFQTNVLHQNLNISRRLSTSHGQTSDYQWIVMLLSKNDVPALRWLLTVAVRHGAGIKTVIKQIERAAEGLYSPHGNWSQQDIDIAFLAKALGGPQLLYALQKSSGLPSVSSVLWHCKPPQLLPSLKVPTKEEMKTNITALLGPGGKPAPKRNFAGQVDMWMVWKRCM